MNAEPVTLYQVVALAAMVAFVVYLFRADGKVPKPRGSSLGRRPTVVGGRSFPASGGRSPEVERLHAELSALVYGDEELVKRLVDYERRSHPTREACYRAAIKRLLRDRLN
ncbi:MAG TPA: hypothetical protein VFN03_11855 [Trueperaceae bacterium]|nr:hypothetical protein [Trueperaceae bacterium]